MTMLNNNIVFDATGQGSVRGIQATVIVTGFSKVLSVVRSNTLPVAVKSVGSAGISATERMV